MNDVVADAKEDLESFLTAVRARYNLSTSQTLRLMLLMTGDWTKIYLAELDAEDAEAES